MANFYLLKSSILAICLLGVLAKPNQNNAKPVNDEHGDAQGNPNGQSGNHGAGKNECAGNSRQEGVQECNDGTGICVWRDDKIGNNGHKECLTSCGPLPSGWVPDHASSPEGFDPEAPENMVVGASVTFACDGSFVSSCADTDAICLASGEWLLPDFECTFNCGDPGVDPEADPPVGVSWFDTLEGDVAIIQCPDGFESIGDNILTCVYNGETETGDWAEGDGDCIEVCDVSDLTSPKNNADANDDAEGDLYPVGASVSYTCQTGYSGCVTATCTSGGTWDYSGECKIVCADGTLQLSHNGGAKQSYDEEYVVDAVVTYTCPAGTSGCVTATCNAQRGWDYSGSCDPVCDPADITTIDNADREDIPLLDNFFINSVVEFECKDTFTGNPYLQCVADGDGGATWSPVGQCDAEPYDCGPFETSVPFAVQQSDTDPCATEEGDEVVYECLNSEATVTYECTDEGWIKIGPDCPPPGCEAPEQTMDDLNQIGETAVDGDISTATYGTCADGTTTLTRTCDASVGVWVDGVPATCPDPACGSADPSMDGLPKAEQTVDDATGISTALYGPCCVGCDVYSRRTCDPSDGNWVDAEQCPATENLPCDISELTGRSNDNHGYAYQGCCYYATEAEKTLDGPAGKPTNAVSYCDANGLDGAELAVPQSSGEAAFIHDILFKQKLAEEIWVGYIRENGQWVSILDGTTVQIWYNPIDITESAVVDGICLGLRDDEIPTYFTTECSESRHRHKAVCKVCSVE